MRLKLNWTISGMCLPILLISCIGSSKKEGIASLPHVLYAHTATALDNRIFVVGGSDGRHTLSSRVYAYNHETNQWNPKADLQTGRWFHAAARTGEKLYVFGGCGKGGNPFLSSVECYDPGTDRWTKVTDLPTPRNRMPAVAWRGKVYVLGGFSMEDNTDVVEIYDPATNTWENGPSLPVKTHGFGAVVLGDRIHVIGGVPPMHVRLDGSKWMDRALAPGTLFLFSGYAVVHEKLYIMGGHVGNSYVHEYDPQKDTWKVRSEMPLTRDRFSIAVLENRLYAIGGQNTDSGWPLYSSVERYDPEKDLWE